MTPLASEILSILPKLRRYSFALIGDRRRGDRYIEIVLETLLQEPTRIVWGDDVRFKLYELLHDVVARLEATRRNTFSIKDDIDDLDEQGQVRNSVLTLPLPERKILLLTIVEDFTIAQAAALAAMSLMEASTKITSALRTLSRRRVTGATATHGKAASRLYA